MESIGPLSELFRPCIWHKYPIVWDIHTKVTYNEYWVIGMGHQHYVYILKFRSYIGETDYYRSYDCNLEYSTIVWEYMGSISTLNIHFYLVERVSLHYPT